MLQHIQLLNGLTTAFKEHGHAFMLVGLAIVLYRLDAVDKKIDAIDPKKIAVTTIDNREVTLYAWVEERDKLILKLMVGTDLYNYYDYPGFTVKPDLR